MVFSARDSQIVPVSVIIPTYNRAATLRRAIDSVLAQRMRAAEIIVVDDGSTDDTAQLLAGYGEQIRTIRQSNRGVSAARNRGIQKSRYPWIALLDSDDRWHPRKLERQWALHRERPDLRWSHTEEIWMREGRVVRQRRKHAKPEGACFDENLSFCKIAPSTVMAHRSLFVRYGLFDEALAVCEDYDMWLRILREEPIALVPEALTTKYAGADQLSRAPYLHARYQIEALMKHLPHRGVAAEILRKCAILEKGAKKHRNGAMLRFCAAVRTRLSECGLFEDERLLL